ncbi:MAG: phosphatidylserine decarboxylase family protein [Bacteroidia bacterium]
MKIHKEGITILIVLFLVLLVINIIIVAVFPVATLIKILVFVASLIVFLLVLQFFRHPHRNIMTNEEYVLAPADGKVVTIEEVEETEVLKDKRIQISIFMSPLKVHVNRYPISGKITFLKYHPGLYLVAWHPKSSTENERTTCVIDHSRSVRILMRQIAGAVARRIIYYPKVNDIVKQGAEMGFIKFGSRVDLFLPLGTKINVQLNQKVRGGETVIAEFNN